MGLALKYDEVGASPILVCDSCGKRIEDWKLAVASCEKPAEEETFCSIFIHHKGSCDPGMPLRYELNNFLPFLLWKHNWGTKRRGENGNEVIYEMCVEVGRIVK